MNNNYFTPDKLALCRNRLFLPALFALLLLVLPGQVYGQYSLQGKVSGGSGEILPGATVQLDNQNKTVASNNEGMFSIDGIQESTCTMSVSFVGYTTFKTILNLKPGVNRVTINLQPADILTEDVIVSATRAGNKTPVAYATLDLAGLSEKNSGQDMPYLLSLTPSLVATSDAGTGIGYTNFRIRGSDANRINMTVNGIPLNDAESHAVYFVDMPDIASSTDNIQVQRGVGSSTNGAGAFGGTINMQTSAMNKNSYASWSTSGGSFHTLKNSVMLGSGLLGGKFIAEARLSKISSEGYVDRANSELHSYYLAGGYFTEKSMLKAILFSGKEKTYQAWYGVPSTMLESDRTYNPAGIIYGEDGSVSFYDNETDNYQQDHYQLHYTHQFSNRVAANLSLHYTYGRGYYEEYRQDQGLADYRMPDVLSGDSVVSETDLIRRKWLDNDFYGAVGSVSYKGNKAEWIFGSAWNHYAGDNFGKVIWAQYYGTIPVNHEWYRSQGDKKDFNFFTKLNYQLSSRLSVYADLQYRHIDYTITGIDDNLRNLDQAHLFDFFNPKAGVYYNLKDRQSLYFSYGNAHREPNRSNYTDADPSASAPRHEKLHDFELGYKGNFGIYSAGLNLYDMIYRDQLILTGRINDVGSAIMTNVPESYRMGIEYTGNLKVMKNLTWDHNLTLSRNKIRDFVEYVDDWDQWGNQVVHELGQTDISFSPSVTAGSMLSWEAGKELTVRLQSIFVSKQYLDNTSCNDRSLDSYFVSNLKLDYRLPAKMFKKWMAYATINNLLNEKYESNGWVYSYYYGGSRNKMDGYFPQAGISYLLGMTIDF